MPVPTDTFWNIRKLNVIFALSALLLLAATLLLVMEDWNRPWRAYQQDAMKWDTAMDKDAMANALTAQQQQAELAAHGAGHQRTGQGQPGPR